MTTENTLHCVQYPVDTLDICVDETTSEVVLTTSEGRKGHMPRRYGHPVRVKVDDLLEGLGLPKRADMKPTPTPRKAPNGPQRYCGSGNHTWEPVTPEGTHEGDAVRRLRVPGGWVYEWPTAGAVFVPMPEAVGYAI